MAPLRCCTLLIFLAVGCAGPSQRPESPPFEPPIGAVMTDPSPAVPPAVIGYSVRNRPIQLYTFGAGPRPVLVMAAIHGNEPTSFDVAKGLIEELRIQPQSAGGVPVVVIPIANPDGLASRTRTSANKIDLNRNFPASNWAGKGRSKNSYGGAASASEPETNALMQTIERLQPRLIISVHSMDQPCNNYDGPAQAIAELMTRYNHYPAKGNIGYPTPGSLGSWAGIDRQIPMITLELPRKLPASKAWPDNRNAVLAAIAAMRAN